MGLRRLYIADVCRLNNIVIFFLILLNDRWGPQIVLLRFDPSQLGVVDDIVLKMKWSSSILAT